MVKVKTSPDGGLVSTRRCRKCGKKIAYQGLEMRRVSSPVPFPAALPYPYSAMALVVAAVIILMKSPVAALLTGSPRSTPAIPVVSCPLRCQFFV